MTVLFEQSDFASPDETLAQYHHRLHPLPPRRHIGAFVVFGTIGALAFLLALALLGSLS